MTTAYHEFLAIEKPLTPADITHLRSLSPESLVSTTGFIHDQDAHFRQEKYFMRRYFDAHVCLRFNQSDSFSIRIPKDSCDDEYLRITEAEPSLEIGASDSHWIISWKNESEALRAEQHGFDGSEWMSRLVHLREELLHADMRSLYLGWLAAVSRGDVPEEEQEPFRWTGLLSPAQLSLTQFLNIDSRLLNAATATETAEETEVDLLHVDLWLQTLPVPVMQQAIREMLAGCGSHVSRRLSRQYRSWERDRNAPRRLRTVAELWSSAKRQSEPINGQ